MILHRQWPVVVRFTRRKYNKTGKLLNVVYDVELKDRFLMMYISFNPPTRNYKTTRKNSKTRTKAEDIDFTQLGDCIDTAIEVGTDRAAYNAFCQQERDKLMNGEVG